jgi:hypothetical protein
VRQEQLKTEARTKGDTGMAKGYRLELEIEIDGKVIHRYDLVYAKNERDARAGFSTRYSDPSSESKARLKILAVEEQGPGTISLRSEGPEVITIPVLQYLPQEFLVIRPAEYPCCEWGWYRKVWRDAEGHHLINNLKVVGCRGYMEDPPQGGPYFLVESFDTSIGIHLCQEHLEANFPQWKEIRRGAMRSGSDLTVSSARTW